jgi:hypothetical protein
LRTSAHRSDFTARQRLVDHLAEPPGKVERFVFQGEHAGIDSTQIRYVIGDVEESSGGHPCASADTWRETN